MTLREQAEELGIKVDGRWSDERLQNEIDKALNGPEVQEKPLSDEAQDLALRIWEGQSVSLPIKERVRRIKQSLEERELPTSVNLPVDEKYLD